MPPDPDAHKAEVDYILRYGGMCRGCADEDGICPGTGLPCEHEPAQKAVEFVLEALRYGQKHGYLPDAQAAALTEFRENSAKLVKEGERLRAALERAGSGNCLYVPTTLNFHADAELLLRFDFIGEVLKGASVAEAERAVKDRLRERERRGDAPGDITKGV